jgi:hypothetical protein
MQPLQDGCEAPLGYDESYGSCEAQAAGVPRGCKQAELISLGVLLDCEKEVFWGGILAIVWFVLRGG